MSRVLKVASVAIGLLAPAVISTSAGAASCDPAYGSSADLVCLATGGAAVNSLPGNFNPTPATAPSPVSSSRPIVWYNGTDPTALLLNAAANVNYAYLGYEAGYFNAVFDVSGSSTMMFANRSAYNATTYSDPSQGPGSLGFEIRVDTNGSNLTSRTYEKIWSNLVGSLTANNNMRVGFWEEISTASLAVFWVLLDDGGASESSPDADFDDILFKITATAIPGQGPSPVPIPGALPLLLSGLGALGVIGWRRSNKAAAKAA